MDSCWLWLGAVSDDGYRRFWIGTAGGQGRWLREELRSHGRDEELVRELVHGIDPAHPTLFQLDEEVPLSSDQTLTRLLRPMG